jgi:hypothetical protein
MTWICENCEAENSDLTADCEECGEINVDLINRYLEADTDF